MEALVLASELDWTLVRPARLVDAPSVTEYTVADGFMIGGVGVTARVDLAEFLLRELTAPKWVRRAVAVASPNVGP